MFKMAKKKSQAENPKVEESAEITEITESATDITEEPKAEENEKIESAEESHLPNKTIPELILEYVNSQKGEEVELNEYFASLYSVPESMIASKDIKYCLDKMVKDKQITLANSRYHDLGMTYYDRYGVAKKYSILDIKILAKK